MKPRRRKQITKRDFDGKYCLCGCGKMPEGWSQIYFNATCRKRFQRARDHADKARDAALDNATLYARPIAF